MSSQSLQEAVARNSNWINSVITNSKLASQLSELLSIDNLDQKINIQEGDLDAKFVNAKTLRGYKGTWEADTNSPILSNSSGVVGDIYKVSVGGTIDIGSGSITYVVGDLIYLSEDNWIKISPNQISDIIGLTNILDDTVRKTGDQSIAGEKTFTGDVIATTKPNATNDTTVATTAFVRNLIGEIPAGLSFEGTWDADTNTPDLSTETPNNGQFWIVSVNGATDLGGITDWKVGDWAIYVTDGAGTDGWQKVDNSSVLDGQGTGQTVALWSGSGDSNTLTNSPITVSGDDVTFAGNINLLDSEKALFGTGNNLQIWTTGANDYITSNFNSLAITSMGDDKSVDIGTTKAGGTLKVAIRASGSTGATSLFHLGNEKLVTTSTGVTVTGDISAVEGSFTGLVTMTDRLELNDANSNAFIGEDSGIANTTGTYNVALGKDSLRSNTIGGSNVALGLSSGRFITNGSTPNETGVDSIFIGKDTRANSDGETNQIVIGTTAIGNGSNTVTLGNDSIATTYLKGNVTMTDRLDLSDSLNNTFIGEDSGIANTTGTYNVALGYQSLYRNTEGSNNTSIGKTSLRVNTTGFNNTALGNQSLWSNTTGANNTALGNESLSLNTTGTGNTALGTGAIRKMTTGSFNIGLGYLAGEWIADGTTPNETGSNSIFIGKSTRANADGETNQIVIGDSAIGNGSNTVTLGNDDIATTYLKGDVNITGTITGVGGEFLPLAGGTLTGSLSGTSGSFSSSVTATELISGNGTPQGATGSILKLATSSGNTRASFTSEGTSILDFGNQADFDNGGISYNNSTKAMSFKTSTSERLVIDSSGNVGIGTDSPSSSLTVKAGVDSRLGGIGWESNDGVHEWSIDANNAGNLRIYKGTTAVARFDSSGNFGIGTASPFDKLDVLGNARISNSNISATSTTLRIGAYSGNNLTSYGAAIKSFHNFAANSDADLAFFANADNERMRITSAGNVGIGTDSPSTKLEVVGNIKADSFIKDGGVSNQFLKADGSVDTTVYASTDNTYNKTDSDSLFTSKTLSQNISFGESYASNYRSRVLDYGGTFFPRPLGYEIGLMKEQNLFQKAKLSLLPSGVGVGNLHNIKPKNDTFNFTRASSATYIDEDGLIAISPINTPRLNYPLIDGVVNGCPSHLLEPSRLQKIQYSEDFSNAAWVETAGSVTVTSNQFISPNGIQNSDRLQIQSTSSLSVLSSLVSHTINVDITVSAWVKSNTNSIEKIKLFGDYGTSNAVSDEFLVTNIWQRIDFTFTPTATGNRNVGFYNVTNLSTDIQIYGFQAEQGSYPTSYIPNYGTSAGITRVAETANGAGDASTFNDSEGVLMAEISALSNDGSERYVYLGNGTTANRVVIRFSPTPNDLRMLVTSGGSTQVSSGTTNYNITNINKIALKYKQNHFALWVNGVEALLDLSGITPVGLNQLSLSYSGTEFKGNIKQIQYFDSALNDSDLEKLTSWVSFSDMANGQTYSIK